MEYVFEVVREYDGGYCAECLSADIVTEGESWKELCENIKEATTAYCFDKPMPKTIRLHMVYNEVLSCA
jgi:predicted RNase H-like HicB family nuclease